MTLRKIYVGNGFCHKLVALPAQADMSTTFVRWLFEERVSAVAQPVQEHPFLLLLMAGKKGWYPWLPGVCPMELRVDVMSSFLRLPLLEQATTKALWTGTVPSSPQVGPGALQVQFLLLPISNPLHAMR